jgi:tetratricopeptide (TPR) repeat protein
VLQKSFPAGNYVAGARVVSVSREESEVDARVPNRRLRSAWAIVTWTLLLLGATVYVQERGNARLQADWPLWLVGLHAAGGLMAASYARQLTLLTCGVLLGTMALVAGAAGLIVTGQFHDVMFWLCQIALRLSVGTAWTLAIAGAPLVGVWLWRRRRGDRRRLRLAPWWFATVLGLGLVEPLAAVVETYASRELPLKLPGDLPPPPVGEFHVVCLGGSTMAGWPYHPKFGIAPVVEWRLESLIPLADPGGADGTASPRRVVVTNLAAIGENLRQAVQRLRDLRYRPHVVLLYSGHNEFYHDQDELRPTRDHAFAPVDRVFRRSPLFRLAQRALLARRGFWKVDSLRQRRLFDDDPLAAPGLAERRIARFRRQLEALADWAEAQGTASVWIVPAGSESGFDPNRSAAAPGTSVDDCRDLEQHYGSARALEAAGRWEDAAALYRSGLDRQPQFAEFHYRLGACLQQLARHEEAREHFAQALELDRYPVRALADYRLPIAEVAERRGIAWIDAADVLRPQTPHGILDQSMFHDNVHPTLRSAFLLGVAAADRIARETLPRLDRGHLPPADFRAAVTELGITREDLAESYLRTAETLRWLSPLRFDQSQRNARADRYAAGAAELASESPPSADPDWPDRLWNDGLP